MARMTSDELNGHVAIASPFGLALALDGIQGALLALLWFLLGIAVLHSLFDRGRARIGSFAGFALACWLWPAVWWACRR